MAIGNRYELIDFQSFEQQDCLNVYYYLQVSGISGNAADLISAWNINVLPVLQTIQSVFISHLAIGAKNLDDPTDFSLLPHVPVVTGNQVGEAMPPFAAWAFRLTRQQTNIHHGAKRIAGLSEASQDAGVALPGFRPNLDNFAAVLGTNYVGVAGGVYEPRIMRKTKVLIPPSIVYTDFPMGAGQYIRLTTQNTRKFGRGI